MSNAELDRVYRARRTPLLRRVNTSELVASHVRTRIFNGELRQGERVRQDELAQQLGVSRIPVREALIALDREGWLTATPNRGAFVERFDEDAVRDQFEVQGFVFALLARRAAERATEDGIERLRLAQQHLAASDSPQALRNSSDDFLNAFVELARSPHLESVLRRVSTLVPGNVFEVVPGSGAVQRRGTKRIVVALQHRTPEAAADASRKLLQEQAALVIDVMTSRGLFASEHRTTIAGGTPT